VVRRLVVALSVFGLAVAVSTSAAASTARMPAPQRLTSVIALDFDGIRLSPPPKGVRPPVGPSEAWRAAALHIGHAASTYRLVLAQWSSNVPMGPSGPTQALVWLIFGTHVDEPILGPGKHPPSAIASAMWPVDATTGQSFTATYEFPPKEIASLGKALRPYMG
jgi:hypothetical protein